MKKTTFASIALSLVASSFLIGCGSGSETATTTTTTTTLEGVASDPELQGATIFLDANKDGILNNGELNTTTNSLGEYTLNIPQSDVGLPLVVKGGIDRVTKKPFKGMMSTIAQAGNNSQHVTPLTTLVEKYKKANPSENLATIKSKLAAKLGLTSSDLDKNTVTDARILKVALRIHKVLQKVASSSNKNLDLVYATLADKIKNDANLSSALTSTIEKEIANGTLDAAKAKDLSLELANVPDTLSTDGLALSADNIDAQVESATRERDLDTDLTSGKDSLLVKTDDAVKTEKGKHTLEALGLTNLTSNEQDNVLKGINDSNSSDDSPGDLRKKIDFGEIILDTNTKRSIKRENLFNDNGLKNLPKSFKDRLRIGLENDNTFDFGNANNDDFRNRLNKNSSNSLFGNDEDFKARIDAQRNKFNLDKQRDDLALATDSLADGKKIVGSIIKGPIDGAVIKLKDAQGTLVSSTISEKGVFVFPEIALTSDSYTLESVGGSYDDEATKTTVTLTTQSLKTYLTKDELVAILSNKEYIAITPETTIYTDLVKNGMSTTDAKTIITKSMISTTSTLSFSTTNDKFITTGDFTSSFPKDQSEAFARNRAISLSYLVRDQNEIPEKVFDFINFIVNDLQDGAVDGLDTDSDGVVDLNLTQEFSLSRTKLFQDTTSKLRNGQLSDGQKEQLKQMSIDTNKFNNDLTNADANLTALATQALEATTLPTLHVLPVIQDEDGNTTDTKETYTLTATKNVNVTIETPEGNWITPMWRYNNNPLPIVIHTSKGTAMTLNFDNQLDANSTIHWHGFEIPAIMDGGPDVPVLPQAQKTYSFTMQQQAAPLWFHPHPDMETGKQVYMGLAGVYLLSDDISKNLEDTKQIPSGNKDTVLLVQDRRFTAEVNGTRELAYKTMQMDSDGMLGDTVLVNGSVLPKQEVSNTLHRYRLYNVSNARTYDFALSDDSNFTVIGTDGGLLNKPVSVNHILLGAAERVEIVIDFAKYNTGDKILLVSKAFSGGMMNIVGGNTDSNNMKGMLANGTGLTIMRFDVTTDETEDITLFDALPSSAAIITRMNEADAINQGNERQFLMSMGQNTTDGSGINSMSFLINNTPFNMTKINEYVPAGAKEIWSIRNMSPMAHPFHAHAIQYQILTRNGVPATGTDLGWKDTFLVQPGETVRVIGDFSSAEGDYMYHCHILEHEDAGMMGYFRVGDTGNVGG